MLQRHNSKHKHTTLVFCLGLVVWVRIVRLVVWARFGLGGLAPQKNKKNEEKRLVSLNKMIIKIRGDRCAPEGFLLKLCERKGK